jgi:hypothetical protein
MSTPLASINLLFVGKPALGVLAPQQHKTTDSTVGYVFPLPSIARLFAFAGNCQGARLLTGSRIGGRFSSRSRVLVHGSQSLVFFD